MDNITILKNLIGEGKTDIVIEILSSIFKPNNDIYNDIILCKSNVSRYGREMLTIDEDKLQRQKNKINFVLLSIIDNNANNCMAFSLPQLETFKNEIGVFEKILWEFAAMMNGKNDYEYFLSRYPDSVYASLAQRAIQDIDGNYLDGTVIVQLTTSTVQRFEISQIKTFGNFVEIISNLLDTYLQNVYYGQGWVLQLGNNTILKHGRMIVDDYHSKNVKDIRSLCEMGINHNTNLYVKRLKENILIDDTIYSDVMANYQKNVCNDVLRTEDASDELLIRAQQKLHEIRSKTINVFHLKKNNLEEKTPEVSITPPVIAEDKRSILYNDEIVFYIAFSILCLFFPFLLYLFIDTLGEEDARMEDVLIIFFMICMQLLSTRAMWYFKQKK